ncbi:MAG: FAD-dependent oxidoreductase [Pseudomonadota bacterium]
MTAARVEPAPAGFAAEVETLIVGAGAAGLIAALSARDAGREAVVLERDAAPAGSTALSAGLIPAAGTKAQRAAGIEDEPARFSADIQRKAKHENDLELVDMMTGAAAEVVDWLEERWGLPFTVVDDFDYPGHSRRRMHGLPTRSGRELVDRLSAAAASAGADILCDATVTTLFRDGGRIAGVALTRPDGTEERIGCRRLILACNGYGGNRARVARHMPDIAGALWFGHDGNKGEALDWGEALGAETRHLSAYQGHGNVASPHGILITWAVMTEGGVQFNAEGRRFWDESRGYSEAARAVLAQPGGHAIAVFDERIAAIARQFEDFKAAEAQGAVKTAADAAALAAAFDLPEEPTAETLGGIPWGGVDEFGRRFAARALTPPYRGVRVTGALFHTQGGLVVNRATRVLSRGGEAFANLFAAGGAACGVSGSGDDGYLSGNGLLAAATLGRLAGRAD